MTKLSLSGIDLHTRHLPPFEPTASAFTACVIFPTQVTLW